MNFYKRFWQEDYETGIPIIAARYVTSNAIHQMTKLPRNEWSDFLAWLEDYEYEKLALPRPNDVIFLDMPIAVSQRLLKNRYDGDESKKDIHERSDAYLRSARRAAEYCAEKYAWQTVDCLRDGALRSVDDIHAEVLQAVLAFLAKP